MCYLSILGIKISRLSKNAALEKVGSFLQSNEQHTIFTPNPEMLVDAQKDKYFAEVLNSGDLNICDGVGVVLVSKDIVERIPGTDFMLDICRLAEQKKCSVYFLGSGSRKVLDELIYNIHQLFPDLTLTGSHPGTKIQISKPTDRQIGYKLQIDREQNDDILAEISLACPDILFVAFGHGKQEKWIYENLKDLPSIKIAMGVGGAFDYISGLKKRAPKFVRRIGLEWFFRLVYEPKRMRRILKATVVFLFLNFKKFF